MKCELCNKEIKNEIYIVDEKLICEECMEKKGLDKKRTPILNDSDGYTKEEKLNNQIKSLNFFIERLKGEIEKCKKPNTFYNRRKIKAYNYSIEHHQKGINYAKKILKRLEEK